MSLPNDSRHLIGDVFSSFSCRALVLAVLVACSAGSPGPGLDTERVLGHVDILAKTPRVHDTDASRAAAAYIEHALAAAGIGSRAGSLSGGNQQKLVIAREIQRDPKLLIAAQPTRGVDIGAIEFIHRRLVEERDAGTAVLLVSLEMQEVLSLADRIVVIFEGEIVAEFVGGTVDEQRLGLAMVGSADVAGAGS